MSDYSQHIVSRIKNTDKSAIREILKVAQNPEIISLAGGLPAPETFPTKILSSLCQEAIDSYGDIILQYGITEGFLPFRRALVPLLQKRGFFVDTDLEIAADNVCISSGAQGAIDAAAKVLLDEGDIVAVESPTYLGSIKTFKSYGADFISIPMDDHGIIPQELENILKNHKVKVIYLIPTFQNPTGRTLSLKRRKEVAKIVKKYQALIIEDDPYFELRYTGENIVPIKTLAPENVIYIGSLSKVFSPGVRLGYYIAPAILADLMTSVRQGVDVHANSLSQAIAARYIISGKLEKQLKKTLKLYRSKLAVLLGSLDEHFPKNFHHSKPEGGMFVWVEGPEGFDSKKLYLDAIQKKVAFVPGTPFFTDASQGLNTFRLNFTTLTEEKIKLGISRIAELL
jgi:2-aminoadipate transaminase